MISKLKWEQISKFLLYFFIRNKGLSFFLKSFCNLITCLHCIQVNFQSWNYIYSFTTSSVMITDIKWNSLESKCSQSLFPKYTVCLPLTISSGFVWHGCLCHAVLTDLTNFKTLEILYFNFQDFLLQSHILYRPAKCGEVDVVTHRLTSQGADLHISSFMLYLLLLWSRRFQALKGGMSSEKLIPTPAALHGGMSNLVYRLGAEV